MKRKCNGKLPRYETVYVTSNAVTQNAKRESTIIYNYNRSYIKMNPNLQGRLVNINHDAVLIIIIILLHN